LQWLRTATPAPFLILLDLTMPVMNGWQFRREQQRDPGLAAIPVLLVSANADGARQAGALAAAGHLAKPVDADQLLAWIRGRCEGRCEFIVRENAVAISARAECGSQE